MTGSAAAEPAADPGPDLTAANVAEANRLRAFLAEHGGSGTAVIAYLGRAGARIVVVADQDGAYGDAVVSTVEVAAEICERAGISVSDGWTRVLSARIRPSQQDRRRMAGTGR